MDGCPPPRLKRLSNSLGGVGSLCLAGVQENTQLAHGSRVQSASDVDGMCGRNDATCRGVVGLESQEALLLLHIGFLPHICLDVEDLALPGCAVGLDPERVAPQIGHRGRHTHSLLAHLVVKGKRQPICMTWLG